MLDPESVDSLDSQLDALEDSLNGATAMAGSFAMELRRLRGSFAETSAEMAGLERGMSRGLRKAFDAVVLDGAKLSDALRGLAESMVQTVYASALKPVTDHFGSILAQGVAALVPFENGGAFSQGRVMPFADGGIVNGPVRFPMRGGTGLMGEAGPEAILPLSRGADGKLGVQASGTASTTVVMNITTPDVQGFRRSQQQISAQMGRLLSHAQRIR